VRSLARDDDDQELIFEKPLSPPAAAAATATRLAMPALDADEIFTHAVSAAWLCH